MEIKAWEEASWDIAGTCFVAVSTGTRQGSVAEWILPFEQTLLDDWHERRRLRLAPDVPPVPFIPEAEIERLATAHCRHLQRERRVGRAAPKS